MKTLKFITLSVLAVMAWSPAAYSAGLDPYFDTLNTLNRIKPAQNPQWEGSNKTLKSSILNRKNKVIGNLNDIVLTPAGAIASLSVDLDRLHLGKTALNYRDLQITAASRAYIMDYDDKQIEDFYPELLANIETASGDTSDSISVDLLLRSDVVADDGRRIGKVEDVLFTKRGDRAEALLVRVNYKTVGGESVAIPFGSANYVSKGTRFEVKLEDEQADTILEFADQL